VRIGRSQREIVEVQVRVLRAHVGIGAGGLADDRVCVVRRRGRAAHEARGLKRHGRSAEADEVFDVRAGVRRADKRGRTRQDDAPAVVAEPRSQ